MAHPGPVAVLYLHDVKTQQKRLWSRISELEGSDYGHCVARLNDVEQRLLTEATIDRITNAKLKPLVEENASVKTKCSFLDGSLANCESRLESLSTALNTNVESHQSLVARLQKAENLISDYDSALDNLSRRFKDLELRCINAESTVDDVKQNLEFDIQEHSKSIRGQKAHLSQIDVQIKSFHTLMKEQKDSILEKVKKLYKSRDSRNATKSDRHRLEAASEHDHDPPVTMVSDSQPATLLNLVPPIPGPTRPASRGRVIEAHDTSTGKVYGLETPSPTLEPSTIRAPPVQNAVINGQDTPHLELHLQQETVPTQLLRDGLVSQASTNLLIATQPYHPGLAVSQRSVWQTPSTQQANTLSLPTEDSGSGFSTNTAQSRGQMGIPNKFQDHHKTGKSTRLLPLSIANNESLQTEVDNLTTIETQAPAVHYHSNNKTKAKKTPQVPIAAEKMQTRAMTRSQAQSSKKRLAEGSDIEHKSQGKQARR